MALHSTAQGLAGLGRHGDSVLVHMQPQEVAGLQALAQSRGTSLTINPATGMPEAFSLGGLFSSLLPMFAGAMFPGAGFGMAPLLAGAATGAGLAAAKGDNPLMGGLMGGLGGVSGSNLGYGLMGPATTGGGFVPTQAAALTDAEVLKNAASAQSMMTNPTLMKTIDPNIVNAANAVKQSGFVGSALEKAGNFINPKLDILSQQASGAGNLLTGQPGAWDAFKGQFTSAEGVPIGDFGAAMKIGMPVGGAIMGGLEPSDLGMQGPSINELKRQTKYRGPSGQLNLDSNYNPDTGEYEGLPSLRLATGGAVDLNPSVGGGLSDLYNRPEGATTQSISDDGYGMGRLDKLAQQGSLTKAADMFYAAGGPVSFADGGQSIKDASNLDNLPTLNLDTGKNDQGIVGLPIDALFGGKSGAFMNAIMPSMKMLPGDRAAKVPVMLRWALDPAGKAAGLSLEEYAASKQAPQEQSTPTQQGPQGPGYTEPIVPTGPDFAATEPTPMGTYAVAKPPAASTPSYGGDTNTPFMARGGYLDGPGDGLSDSIPATIEGKQPARLADGEFVISSDVVSALGNGSSKAGAKQLYAMMDRVRQKAHGTKKQINKVNPKQVMPKIA